MSVRLNSLGVTIGSKSVWTLYSTLKALNRTFFFDPIIPEDINLEISILQDNKAHGLYSSPVRLLKLAKRVVSAMVIVLVQTEYSVNLATSTLPAETRDLWKYLHEPYGKARNISIQATSCRLYQRLNSQNLCIQKSFVLLRLWMSGRHCRFI